MLFLKRMSDLFDQEREQLQKSLAARGTAAATVDALLDDPDQYTYFVPAEARWSHLRHMKENVGTGLNKALEALEDAQDAGDDVRLRRQARCCRRS